MKKYALTLLLLLLQAGLIFGQSRPSKKKKSIKENTCAIQLRYQTGNSFLHDPLVIMDNCTNCTRKDQESIRIHDFDISFLKRLNKFNYLSGVFGLSEYGFQNDHYPPFPSEHTFENYEKNFFFVILGAGHLLKFRIIELLDLNIGNSLLLDINSPPDDYLIRRTNASYKGTFELEFFPTKRISLVTGLFLKHSITRYNKIKFNKDYYPYNYGALLALKFNFCYRKLR